MATQRSEALKVAEEFQRQLQAADSNVTRAMAARWESVETALSSTLEALADDIAALIEAGETVPKWKLFQMQRYQLLLAQIEVELAKFQGWAAGEIGGSAVRAQEVAREHARQLVMVFAGATATQGAVDFTFARLGVGAAERIAALAQAGKPLHTLLTAAYPLAVDGLTDLLIQGASLGWNPRKTVREAKQQGLAKGLNHFLLVARDQQVRNYREAQRETYQRSSIVIGMRRLAAINNKRTCIACLALHGTLWPLDKAFAIHPQCRCSGVPVLRGRELEEWESVESIFTRRPVNEQIKVMGRGRYAMWKNGDVAFSQMATIKANETWGDNAQVTTIKDLKKGKGGIRKLVTLAQLQRADGN